MTRRIDTLRSLARWRSLGERRSAELHQQRCSDEFQALSQRDVCLEHATALQASHAALVAEGLLDLDRVGWIGHYEAEAWASLEQAKGDVERANRATAQASAAHALARSQKRVADEALAKAQLAAVDAIEKRIFDQLTDMRAGAVS